MLAASCALTLALAPVSGAYSSVASYARPGARFVPADSSVASCARPGARFMPAVRMGGLTGLPRIPREALAATKSFNPGLEYTERIATLWRDLETLYGVEAIAGVGGSRTGIDASRLVDSGVKTNKFRGFTRDIDTRVARVLKAVRKEPSLLNPEVSNRFEFATAKAILVDKLGTQEAAIKVMEQDPSILQLGDALYEMSAGSIRSRANTKQLTSSLPLLVLLLGLVAVATTDLGSDVPQLAAGKQALGELVSR